jgi:hypothetical protein
MLMDMCRSKIRKEWRLSAHTNGNGLSIKKQNITKLRKGLRAILDLEYSALDLIGF